MVQRYPNLPDQGRYTIQEAADLLGVHRDTLRKHSYAGYIKYGVKRNNMRKFYLGSEINKYWKAMF